MKFKSGDSVLVCSGSDRGKTGKILSVLNKSSKVIVEGVNVKKIHQKSNSNQQGGILSVEKPIDISNVSHFIDGKPAKTKWVFEGDKKVLVFKLDGKKVRKK